MSHGEHVNGPSLLPAVLSQIDWWWSGLFRPRLDGVTDDELWWEPAPSSWTLRPGPDGLLKFEWPPGSVGESVPPVTTLAWRLCHMACPCLASWTSALTGGSRLDGFEVAFPSTASGAVELLDDWYGQWRGAVGELSDADLWRPLRGTAFDVGADRLRLGHDDPFLHYLLHQHRELIHHGAEVSLLRDLFRANLPTALEGQLFVP